MERADDLERRLRDRLFKVAARGGDRAADGDRGDFAVSQPDLARALIERGDDGFEVGKSSAQDLQCVMRRGFGVAG